MRTAQFRNAVLAVFSFLASPAFAGAVLPTYDPQEVTIEVTFGEDAQHCTLNLYEGYRFIRTFRTPETFEWVHLDPDHLIDGRAEGSMCQTKVDTETSANGKLLLRYFVTVLKRL